MILFVFEGKEREPLLFRTIQNLFFQKETDAFVCTYNSNIYSLYSKLKKYDVFDGVSAPGDTVSILNEILESKGDHTLSDIVVSDVSQIYLFFDYDFHDNRLTLEENNHRIEEMLHYFSDETENGKLYINYPMVDSIRYTRQLPDSEYLSYTVTRDTCKNFKRDAAQFSFYPSLDHLLISSNPNEKEESKQSRLITARENWLHLTHMNVAKANDICHDTPEIPVHIEDIAQKEIFYAQIEKYVHSEDCRVAILNAFPIFIYEYWGKIPNAELSL